MWEGRNKKIIKVAWTIVAAFVIISMVLLYIAPLLGNY